MARKFSFNIIKPVLAGATPFQTTLYKELASRFPDDTPTPNTNDIEQAAGIVTKIFGASSSNTAEKEIVFDRGISKDSTQRILITQFGDGYEQRIKDGINTKDETFKVNLNNRPWYEIELISSFFDAKTPENFIMTLQE